jgi:hypothetical protein
MQGLQNSCLKRCSCIVPNFAPMTFTEACRFFLLLKTLLRGILPPSLPFCILPDVRVQFFFINLKLSISAFHLVSVVCLLLHTCVFPHHPRLPTTTYLIFCFRFIRLTAAIQQCLCSRNPYLMMYPKLKSSNTILLQYVVIFFINMINLLLCLINKLYHGYACIGKP